MVAKGFSWGTVSQLTGVGCNLALTPYIIHGLGIQRYGLFMLVTTITGVFGGFDGGPIASAGRYFSIFAGADDRKSTTQLLVTSCLLVVALGTVFSLGGWFLSPLVVNLFPMSASLRPQAVFLLRALGILLLTGFVHALFQQVLNARQRYAWSTQASLATYALYVIGFIIVVRTGSGLRGVALIFVGQQVLASGLIVPVAWRYLDRRGVKVLPWQELRRVIGFSSRLQVGKLAWLVNTEVDSLVIGMGLSVSSLGIYNSGANFASQLYAVATNALAPASVHMGHIFGREGEEGAFREFVRLQKLWVLAVTGWSVVAMASVYFGIRPGSAPSSTELGGFA